MIHVRQEGGHAFLASPELRQALIDALDSWRETRDPCEGGHREHTAEDHFGRTLVHTYSPKLMGADWDLDGAVEYIRKADLIGDALTMGHVWARAGEQAYAFAVKPSTAWPPA